MKKNNCKLLTLLFGTLLLFAVLGCAKEKLDSDETDVFLVSYSRSSSWADLLYAVTIDQNGDVVVTEQSGPANKNRVSKYQLSDMNLNLVKGNLSNLVKIDMLDYYGFDNENAPTDVPVTKLTYNTISKSDSASIYFPTQNELPLELDLFMQTLAQIIADTDTMR